MNYEAETQWENDNQDVYIWLINDLSTGEKWLFWYSHKPGETAPFHAGSEFDEDHFELLKNTVTSTEGLLQLKKTFLMIVL